MATGSDSPVIGRAHHFGFDLKHPKRTGWLLKQGGGHKAFKNRFFVLYKGFLVYYPSEEKFRQDVSRQTLANRIHAIKLKKAEIHTAKYPPRGCHFGFTIYAPDPVNKRNGYLFNAQDKQDRKEWILALRDSTGTPHKPRVGSELEAELSQEAKKKEIIESTKNEESKESRSNEEKKDNEKPGEVSEDVQVATITMTSVSDDDDVDELDEGVKAEEGVLLVDKEDMDSEEEKGPEPEASPFPPHKDLLEQSPLIDKGGEGEDGQDRSKSPLPEVKVDSGDSDSSSEAGEVRPKEGSIPPPGVVVSRPEDDHPQPTGETTSKDEDSTTSTNKEGTSNGDVHQTNGSDSKEEDALAPPLGSLKKRTSIAFSGKQGLLYKRGGKYQSWKQRWFILSPGTFTYYKKKGDTKELGEVKLKNMQIFHPGQGEREQSYQFTVHTESSWNKRK